MISNRIASLFLPFDTDLMVRHFQCRAYHLTELGTQK